jgi:hypothetical protein
MQGRIGFIETFWEKKKLLSSHIRNYDTKSALEMVQEL